MLQELCNPFTFSILAACINTLVFWIEHKMIKAVKQKKEYLKQFIITFFISLIILFLYDSIIDKKQDVEMYTGNPEF